MDSDIFSLSYIQNTVTCTACISINDSVSIQVLTCCKQMVGLFLINRPLLFSYSNQHHTLLIQYIYTCIFVLKKGWN